MQAAASNSSSCFLLGEASSSLTEWVDFCFHCFFWTIGVMDNSWELGLWFSHGARFYVLRSRDRLSLLLVPNTLGRCRPGPAQACKTMRPFSIPRASFPEMFCHFIGIMRLFGGSSPTPSEVVPVLATCPCCPTHLATHHHAASGHSPVWYSSIVV